MRLGLSFRGLRIRTFIFTLSLSGVGVEAKDLRDTRIDLVHIANIKGSYSKLLQLIPIKIDSEGDLIWLIGGDTMGKSPYWEADNRGEKFAELLPRLFEGKKSILALGRTDVYQPEEVLKRNLKILKDSKIPILATNYERKGMTFGRSHVLKSGDIRVGVLNVLTEHPEIGQTAHTLEDLNMIRREMSSLSKRADVIVLVTEKDVGRQKVLVEAISKWPEFEKLVGVLGNDPKEKTVEYVRLGGKKVFLHQAVSSSHEAAVISIVWKPDGERAERFQYVALPGLSQTSQRTIQSLERALSKKFPNLIAQSDGVLKGPQGIDDLYLGTNPLGRLIANAFRAKGLKPEVNVELPIVGLFRGTELGTQLPAGPITEADLVKALHVNVRLEVLEVDGATLEALVRQDEAHKASKGRPALQWSDNLRLNQRGGLSIDRRKLDPTAKYLLVTDALLVGGTAADGRPMMASGRGQSFFNSKKFKRMTQKLGSSLTERDALKSYLEDDLKGEVKAEALGASSSKPVKEDLQVKVRADALRYLPLESHEIERIKSNPWAVLWTNYFPDNDPPSEVLVIDRENSKILGVLSIVRSKFGRREEVLRDFTNHIAIVWNESNAGPKDPQPHFGLLVKDYKPFPKPIELAKVRELFDIKQMTLRNRVVRDFVQWMKKKSLVAERERDVRAESKEAIQLYAEDAELAKVKSQTGADAVIMGVYHSVLIPQRKPKVYKITGSQLKKFFKENPRRQFVTEAIQFGRDGIPAKIDGEPIQDRRTYSIASPYADNEGDFFKTFEQGGKMFAGNAIRAGAVEKALEKIRSLVGPLSEDEQIRMEPIRDRSKDLKAELWPHGLQIFPNGEYVETGGEIDQMPEDLVFERAFKRIFEVLNPAQKATVEISQKAISLLAQIEVVSRLTEDSLKIVREKTNIIFDVLKELETLPENIRDVFENPIIMGLIQSGYRPTVDEAGILQKLYAGKPEDYDVIIKTFIDDPQLRELLVDKLRVIPPSFFNSPSSTTGSHHSKDQFFPNGQMEHDKSVLVLIRQLLKSKGFSQPLIEGVLYGMAAHDGWSHELSSINAFFTQFGIAGSRAILKGYLDFMLLYFPKFEAFLKKHPRFKEEDLKVMREQHDLMKDKMGGEIVSTNLRSDIKRMMLSSPLLAFSDLKPAQETWFVKNLSAYILMIHAAPEINARVREQLSVGAQNFSIREIVRQVIDEKFGSRDPKTGQYCCGLDGVAPEERKLAAKERSAFTERGAKWIEDKLIYYVGVNTFGPMFEKRLDASSVYIARDVIARQVVPSIPDDEFQIVSRVLSAAPSYKQPYGQELGRGSWTIEHPYKLLGQMVHITKIHAQKIRQSGRERIFLERYKEWGADVESILINMHFIAAGHMGAYQLRPEVIHRILSVDGVPSELLKRFLSTWFWTDTDGFVYDEKNPFHQSGLTANQADSIEAMGYISVPKAGMDLPSKFKIRIKREVSYIPKEGFVEIDRNRSAPRGKTVSDFIRSPGDAISQVEYKRHYARVSVWDHRGKNITDDPRMQDLVKDFVAHVPGEFDDVFSINPPALYQKKLRRLELAKKKRERQQSEEAQDERLEQRAREFATTIEALRETDPEALEDLEAEFGITDEEINAMLSSSDPQEWREFLRERSKLIARLQNIPSARRGAYKVIPAAQLSADELKLRIAEDRIHDVRANDLQAVQLESEGRQERNALKEATYLEKIAEFLRSRSKKWAFVGSWSHDALIGLQLALEYFGEEMVLRSIKDWGATAVVFETLYGGSFSFPFDGEERFEAFEGLVQFITNLSEGRGDSARSVIYGLGRDPIKVQNYFRWIREGSRAGIRGLRKIASDAGKGVTYVLGNYAQLEIAMVARYLESRGFPSGSLGLENIAGFEVPMQVNDRIRVVDLLLKTGEAIEIKNYSPESYLEFLPQILSQFEADVRLHKKDLFKLFWVFRGVEVDFRGTLEKFKEILKREGFKDSQIKKFLERNLIFLGLSGKYERYRNTGMSDARLSAAQLLNEKYYKEHQVLEPSPVEENLDLKNFIFKEDLAFNWAGPNQVGSDFGAELIAEMRAAKKSFRLIMYDLEEPSLVDELIATAKRIGPDNVKIVLEGSNYRDVPWTNVDELNAHLKTLPLDEQRDFLFENADGANSMAPEHLERMRLRVESRIKQLERLRRAKIKPTLIPKRKMAIMHIKYATRDGTSALVTSANATRSDLYGDFEGKKKVAEANVNFMLRFTAKEIVQLLEEEFDLLAAGLVTKTSRESWPQARTFTDKTGSSWTIGFAPFAGAGDMADVIQKSLEGIKLTKIYAEQFVFSDPKLAGILQRHIRAGAKRYMIFDDHFSTEPHSKAPFFMGLLARDWKGELQSDRGTGEALIPLPLRDDEVVASWNGRVNENKNIEAKMHMKSFGGEGVDAKGKPIYWVVLGSGNSSYSGLTGGNNEIWMIHKTHDPRLYHQLVSHFENRLKDHQTRDLRVDFAKALVQSLVDPRGSRRAIEYLHADAYGKRLADRLEKDPRSDIEQWASGQISLREFATRIQQLTKLPVRPQALLLLAAWKQTAKSKTIFDLINFVDVVLVKETEVGEVAFFLDRALQEPSQRKFYEKLRGLHGLSTQQSTEELMALLDSKIVKLEMSDSQYLKERILLEVGQRRLLEDTLRTRASESLVEESNAKTKRCRDHVKKIRRK